MELQSLVSQVEQNLRELEVLAGDLEKRSYEVSSFKYRLDQIRDRFGRVAAQIQEQILTADQNRQRPAKTVITSPPIPTPQSRRTELKAQ